jgi:murein DD-endopeptidase MepM/ murein hydrolase activator NlpD
MKRVLMGLLLAVLLTLVGAEPLNNALRRPPTVRWQAPAEVAAGLPFTVTLEADQNVHFAVRYASQEQQQEGREAELSFVGDVGQQRLDIVVTDARAAQYQMSTPTYGLPEVVPLLQVPREVLPGQAFMARVQVPSALVSASDVVVTVSLEGERQPLPLYDVASDPAWSNHVAGASLLALGSVPLGTPAGEVSLDITVRDSFGRQTVRRYPLTVLPDERPLETLNIPAELLPQASSDNRTFEEAALREVSVSNSPTPLWQAPFILPTEGEPTSLFGDWRRYSSEDAPRYHTGHDIAALVGTSVLATNDGVVVLAGDFPIRGGLVVIDHGANVFSHYAHLEGYDVREGDTVSQGEVIGRVGSTGMSTGPHLHWEMRIGDQPTSPLEWVGQMLPPSQTPALASN